MDAYVHGYHPDENERLNNQAHTLTGLLHFDTVYPAGHAVLEAGCGVGAQTVTLETSYVKLTGSQAPSINNGQTVTTVTLQDRDGIILLRQVSQKVPNPPSNITIKP